MFGQSLLRCLLLLYCVKSGFQAWNWTGGVKGFFPRVKSGVVVGEPRGRGIGQNRRATRTVGPGSIISNGITTVNATIKDGYLTSLSVGGTSWEWRSNSNFSSFSFQWVGSTSSAIQQIIEQYFPRLNASKLTENIKYKVWLNSSKALSYLTLIGKYTADVPLFLPDLFVLVLDNAHFEAVHNFTAPDNLVSIEKSFSALIVSKGAFFNAVVSPGGPSQAVLSCARMPRSKHST